MATTVADLITQAKSEPALDATDAQVLEWLNQRYKEMVAYARGAEMGQAAGTASALLPADVSGATTTASLAIDPDCYSGLVAGTIARGLIRLEHRADLAEPHEQEFQAAAERMRVRTQQRYVTQTTDTVQTLLNEAVASDGFDATQTQLLLWLNRRHREMVAESRSYRDKVSIGPTVDGTAFYAVTGVVETYAVEINGVPFQKARRPDIYGFAQDTVLWHGYEGSGFVVEDVTASNVQGFTVLPTPETSGLSIDVVAAVFPPTLVAGDPATALKVDEDCYDGLISGVIATGLLRAGNDSQAATHEQIYGQTIEMLRRRVKRRFNTSGPAQIRLLGINA
jgi:hypothetical protein